MLKEIRNTEIFHLGTRFKEINIDRKHSRSFESGLREATIKPCDLQKVKYESLKQFASPISYLLQVLYIMILLNQNKLNNFIPRQFESLHQLIQQYIFLYRKFSHLSNSGYFLLFFFQSLFEQAMCMLGLNPTEQEAVDIPNEVARQSSIIAPIFSPSPLFFHCCLAPLI